MRSVLFALCCVLVPALHAQTVGVYASVDSIRVGEPFEITLVARHGILREAVFPDTSRAFAGEDVVVLEKRGSGTGFGGADAPGTRVDSAVYRVAAFALDTLVIPPIAVGFAADGDTLLVPSLPFALPMIATAAPDADSLRPARDRMDMPWPWWSWLLAALTLVALAAAAWWLLKKSKPTPKAAPAPVYTPSERALRRLATLESADLADPAQVKPYYVELTEALRQFLEDVTPIPALELTSGEVLRQARVRVREGAIPDGIPEKLAEIFAVADYAKFADGLPDPAEGEKTRQHARDVINRIEMRRAMHATPEPAEQP